MRPVVSEQDLKVSYENGAQARRAGRPRHRQIQFSEKARELQREYERGYDDEHARITGEGRAGEAD